MKYFHAHQDRHDSLVAIAEVCQGLAADQLNPGGLFFNSDVVADQGTYQGGERPAPAPGEALPLITCADLAFTPGTWHFIAEAS